MRLPKNKPLFISTLLMLVLVAAVLFFRLGRADVTGDSATYLYRSLGYIDYMSSTQQTTPLQWFTQAPWWARLGFHDAPVLYFATHHLILKISNADILFSRALHALFGMIIALLAWRYAYRRAGLFTAWLCTALFLALTPLITIHRTNLLESFMLIWLAAGLFSFIAAQEKPRWYYASAVFFGAAMLTKYTAIFVIAGPLLWLLLQPKILRTRTVLGSIGIFTLLLLPIVVYNVAMYRTVGHPDLQFSSMLSFDTTHHWPAIQRTLTSNDATNHLVVLSQSIYNLLFPTVLAFVLIACAFFLYSTYKKKGTTHIILTLTLLTTLAGTWLTGSSYRFLAPLFLVLFFVATHAIIDLTNWLTKRTQKIAAACAISILLIPGWIETANTAYATAQPKGIFANDSWEPSHGFAELDAHLQKFFSNRYPGVMANIWGLYTANTAVRQEFERVVQKPMQNQTPFTGLIIMDERTPWFSRLWAIERWNLYRGFTIITSREYSRLLAENPKRFDAFTTASLIVAHHPERADLTQEQEQLTQDMMKLEKIFVDSRAPSTVLYDKSGAPAFTLYGALAQ